MKLAIYNSIYALIMTFKKQLIALGIL